MEPSFFLDFTFKIIYLWDNLEVGTYLFHLSFIFRQMLLHARETLGFKVFTETCTFRQRMKTSIATNANKAGQGTLLVFL